MEIEKLIKTPFFEKVLGNLCLVIILCAGFAVTYGVMELTSAFTGIISNEKITLDSEASVMDVTGWKIIKQEPNTYIKIENPESESTKICEFYYVENLKKIPEKRNLYINDVKITELSKIQDNNILSRNDYGYCYEVSSKDKIRFGENSTVIEYINQSIINFKHDWGEVNIDIQKCINVSVFYINDSWINETTPRKEPLPIRFWRCNEYGYVNDLYIFLNKSADKYDFGGVDYSLKKDEWGHYRMNIESSSRLTLLMNPRETKTYNYSYPEIYIYHENEDDEWNEHRHIFSFEGLCDKEDTDCSAELSYSKSTIYFDSQRNIDTKSITSVTGCRTLNDSSTIYNQTADVIATGHCMIVVNNSITYDGNNHWIKKSNIASGWGLYGFRSSSDYIGTNLTSVNITMSKDGGVDYGKGAWISSNDSIVTDSIFKDQYWGLILEGNNITVDNVESSENTQGIRMFNLTNSLINNSKTKINTYGLYAYNVENLTIQNHVSWNNVRGMVFITIPTSIINKNIMVRDSAISVSSIGDIYFHRTQNATALNVTYDTEWVDSLSLLRRKWYYRAFVNVTNGENITGGNISLFGVGGNFHRNLSASNGFTDIFNIIEYQNINNVKTYYSNYSVYANKGCYPGLKVFYNVTENENNLNHVLTLGTSTYKNNIFDCGCSLNYSMYSPNHNLTISGSGKYLFNDSLTLPNSDPFLTIDSPCDFDIGMGATFNK